MKKNTQLHLVVETDLFERLKKQAKEEGTTISELCRQKLREGSRLIKIEMMLEKILSKNYILEDRKVYKRAGIENSNIE